MKPHANEASAGNARPALMAHVAGQPGECVAVACPFCHNSETQLVSLFGGNAGESLLSCTACRSLFHWIKGEGMLPTYPVIRTSRCHGD